MKSFILKAFFNLLIIFVTQQVSADIQTWNVTELDQVITEREQLVVNTALGVLHPSLYVRDFKVGFTPYYIDVGNGEHGAFELSSYARFSINGDVSGNVIRLDTNIYPQLNVTQFKLASGWVLDVVGDNPLVINSLTNIEVAGEIWCHGDDGEDASLVAAGEGGRGRCGGSDGGNGGNNIDLAQSAEDRGAVGGGQAGSNASIEMNGGGGGSWNDSSAATAGGSANNGFGDAGVTLADPEFLNLLGSAGGGGGGTGTGNQPGAGGGGGGGLVVLHAVQDIFIGESPASVTGLIRINGGNGGDSLTTTGGAGGGGGAGSLQVFAGRNIELFNTIGSGVVISQSGLGGNNGAESGGNGGRARNWFSSVGYNNVGAGFYNPAEQAPVLPGVVEFTTELQEAQSLVFDLKNTLAQIQNILITPSSPTFSWQVAGSEDNFQNDNTGWTTDLNLLRNKRFIKIKALINATNVNNPDKIQSVQLIYQPGLRGDFEFESSSCGKISNMTGPGQNSSHLFFFLFPFLLTLFLKRKSNGSSNNF